MVFKTQQAYNMYWSATTHTYGFAQEIRSVIRMIITTFDTDGNSALRIRVRRSIRFAVVFYLAAIEYFQRTGSGADHLARTRPEQVKA